MKKSFSSKILFEIYFGIHVKKSYHYNKHIYIKKCIEFFVIHV